MIFLSPGDSHSIVIPIGTDKVQHNLMAIEASDLQESGGE